MAVVFDKWDLKYGDDLAHYMETSVRQSGSVIMVCTPTYAKKANAGIGGAGYEKQIVTGEMFQGASASKFIPLIRKGSDSEALPSFLKSRNYIDFRNDSELDKKLEDLLRQLHNVPRFSRPPLGESPFNTSTPGQHVIRTAPKISGLPPPLDMILNPRTKPKPAPEAGITTVSSEHRVYQEAVIIQPESFKKYRASLISGQDLTVQVGADDWIRAEIVSLTESPKLEAGKRNYEWERGKEGKNLNLEFYAERNGNWLVYVFNLTKTPLEVGVNLTVQD